MQHVVDENGSAIHTPMGKGGTPGHHRRFGSLVGTPGKTPGKTPKGGSTPGLRRALGDISNKKAPVSGGLGGAGGGFGAAASHKKVRGFVFFFFPLLFFFFVLNNILLVVGGGGGEYAQELTKEARSRPSNPGSVSRCK